MTEEVKKTIFKYFEYFILFLLAFISLNGLILDFDANDNNIIFNGDKYIYILILIGYFYILKAVNKIKDKRLNIISIIFSSIVSIVYILSYMTSNYFLDGLFSSSLVFVGFIILKLLATFILFTAIIKFLYKKIEELKKDNNIENKYFTGNKKSLLLITLIIFIAYVPYLIHSFPGNLNYDFIVQIKQALNIDALTNWHPYIHTLFIGLCLKIGYFLTNSYNIGIFIYTLLQVLLSCFTFSFVIYYMAKKEIKTKFRLITLLMFMFFPMFPLYSVWLTKDIVFSLFMVYITIGIIEICTNKEIIKSKRYIAFMIVVFLLAMLSRKNGLYMLVILFPFILLFNRKNWLRVCIMFLLPVLIFKVIDGPIRTSFDIPDGSKAEMYSIPAQQMARIYKYEFENLTEEQKEKIESYIIADDIAELYNPLISDKVKANLNIDKIDSNKLDLLKFDLELLIEYPVRTIESFLCTTYRFYYLDNDGAKGLENFKRDSASLIDGMLPKELNIRNDFANIKIIDLINDAIYVDEVLVISTTTNPGLYFNIFILCIGYLIYSRKYKIILAFLPVLLIMATQLAGPMVDIRYAYCMFTCFPILVGVTIYNINKKEKV